MIKLTNEQAAAIESRGKVIVSASAGSGKTFVMIQKLVNAIADGADLDEVLAVTFTKKAAAQMKEKLRSALIKRMDGADAQTKSRLKIQLAKISSASISTIHAFCAKLIRTYFYMLDTDGGFDIISADDAFAKDLKAKALDNLFERFYEDNDKDFTLLLSCYLKKRSDGFLRSMITEGYNRVRSVAYYKKLLCDIENLYTEAGFNEVCVELSRIAAGKLEELSNAVNEFAESFPITKNAMTYFTIFGEMKESLEQCARLSIFDPKPPLSRTRKPTDAPEDKEAGEKFKSFRADVLKRFSAITGGYSDECVERKAFLESGKTAAAFARILLKFDEQYASLKRDENKLDYNDLEHLTLELLENDSVRREINSKFKYVFVDEYQDVNPVQEEIISEMGEEVFLVGDVKQAIYGFRGSRSLFFAQKYDRFDGGGGTALRLTGNFRSGDGVISFVNSLFSEAMRESVCDFNYSEKSRMTAGGIYPQNCGSARIHIFGKEEKQKKERGVYSVKEDGRMVKHTREGLAVLKVVEEELSGVHYDLAAGVYADTQPGDICILTRKNKGGSAEGIIKALTDAGYAVAGAQESNICMRPEVKQMLDILSYIDNAEQDVPLVSTMLSPLGGFSENELALIRIAFKAKKRISFRKCCKSFADEMRGELADRVRGFFEKTAHYRELSEILTAGGLADKILADSGLEAIYSSGGGEKLKNIMRLMEEGASLTLSAFLRKIKAGGYDISAPASASSDSIKIMTMHASKGLEFPVVILADVCRTFKGRDFSEMPFDEKYGFAPKFHNRQTMLTANTVLRRLVKLRADREELKNELNLFYVACTRAMCNLHIMAEEVVEYSSVDAPEARCYAQTFDMAKFSPEELQPAAEIIPSAATSTMLYTPDQQTVENLAKHFNAAYAFPESIILPVKSSASAILRARDEKPYHEEYKLYGGEDETGTERGTAYHRFLELCDFSKSTPREIREQTDNFVLSGRLTQSQAELLDAGELSEILKMPAFSNLQGAQLFREREFLCKLPANKVLPTSAEDGVLIQGAIDLMAQGDFGLKIIDYKYSHKSDESLLKTYSGQLALYKKAASVITGVAESNIETIIINIHLRRQINVK